MLKALHWEVGTNGLITIKEGYSDFVRRYTECIRFSKQENGKPELYFSANIVKDTPANRDILNTLQNNYRVIQELVNENQSKTFQLLNKIERWYEKDK